MNEYILFFFTLIFLALNIYLFNKFGNKISNYFGLIDHPDNNRKRQIKAVSLIGGIFLYTSFLIIFFVHILVLDEKENLITISQFFFISMIFFLGILDDKYDLNPNLKIFSCFILFLKYLYFNQFSLIDLLYIREIDLTINVASFNYIFTSICFLIFINACNMFDGIDGQSGVYFLFLLLYLFFLNNLNLFIILFALPVIFFLCLNLFEKWYMGDSGVLFLSFVTAILIIQNYNQGILVVEQIFLIMMLPGIDLIRLFFERIKNKKHPFSADTRHLHHLLLKKFNKKKTLLINSNLIIIPNLLALYFNTYFIFIFITLLIYIYIVFYLVEKKYNLN
tara:strand:+ start:202 stop:1209 length:1008 start_codon:yes stop_codon:yes gene_type:complete